MRSAGIELHGFPWFEREVVLSQDQAQRAVEDVGPVIALVCAELGFTIVVSGRQDELVGLNASGPAGQGHNCRTVAEGDGAQVDAGITGGRRVNEFVEADAVSTGERQELLKRGPPQTSFEPGQRADRDSGFLSEFGEGDIAAESKVLQSRPNSVDSAVQVLIHVLKFAIWQEALHFGFFGADSRNDPRRW